MKLRDARTQIRPNDGKVAPQGGNSAAAPMFPPREEGIRGNDPAIRGLGFGPNPDNGTYAQGRCHYCSTYRLCRHDAEGDMWLCNGKLRCYGKRWLLRGRKARRESLR